MIEKDLVYNKTVVIKIGGNALTHEAIAHQLAKQVAILRNHGASIVLVHGGGIEINSLLKLHGLQSEFVDGHRITDENTLSIIEMALSGKVNKQLVEALQKQEIPAVGLSGKDGRMVRAVRRVHSYYENGELKSADLGLVGDVAEVNPALIHLLLGEGFIPVISPISAGVDDGSLNVNADLFAGHLAAALKADHFVAMSNIDGVMKDPRDPKSIISHLTGEEAENLSSSIIQGGMIPKIDSCLIALRHHGCSAHIVNGTKDDQLLRIFTPGERIGTTISAEE